MTHTTTKKTNAIVAVAAAVLLLPGLLTACSGSPSGGSSDTPKAGGNPGTSLSACMRDKGYDMADPGSGSQSQTLAAPEGVDKDQWDADLQTCLGGAGGAGKGMQEAKPADTAEQQKRADECIRKNGFSDYPDSEDAKRSYRPGDQDVFSDVAQKCTLEAYDEEQGK